jgi:hypothetical protein
MLKYKNSRTQGASIVSSRERNGCHEANFTIYTKTVLIQCYCILIATCDRPTTDLQFTSVFISPPGRLNSSAHMYRRMH